MRQIHPSGATPGATKTTMKTITLKTTRRPGTVEAFLPERADIDNLKVGDMAPDCFGGMRRVEEVFARDVDRSGRHFVCFRLDFGPGSTISGSLKEGELVRSVKLTGEFSSTEIDFIEDRERRSLGIIVASTRRGGFFTTEAVRDFVASATDAGDGWVELVLRNGEKRFVRGLAWAA